MINKYTKAVTIGDINGIGIILLIKLLKQNKIKNFILISNFKILKNYIKKKKIKIKLIKLNKIEKNIKFKKNYLYIYNIEAKNNFYNTYNSLKKGYELTKQNIFKALITLPLNKEKIIKNIDKNFTDQTNLLSKLDNKINSNMIFYSKKIIVSPLTTHLPLIKVSNQFKKKNEIKNKILLLIKTLKKDFNILNPKIAISGINPHSGENGNIGKEEIKFLIPILNKLKLKKITIYGPYPGDTLFIKKNINKFDCFLCCYHDQALIPFKILNNFSGVNYTGSLDIIRTSPDHGPAYDLIKNKNASTNSLLLSFNLANKIIKNRKI